jgi:hypothetical protein
LDVGLQASVLGLSPIWPHNSYATTYQANICQIASENVENSSRKVYRNENNHIQISERKDYYVRHIETTLEMPHSNGKKSFLKAYETMKHSLPRDKLETLAVRCETNKASYKTLKVSHFLY